MATSARDLAPGDVFDGKYRIVRRLGAGGMGAVFVAEHVRVPGQYALKVMLPHLAAGEDFRARFFREIQVARALVHPNVIVIRDCDVAGDGTCYYTMDLSTGRPLSALPRPLEVRRALHLVRQVLEALAAAHRMGIV
ncbi:MAG TPA: serine/threonine protein kinase, partial [Planctomycetota bacterium]|nr:serine/threonine protein kinase [Planctomycetota bacterium]